MDKKYFATFERNFIGKVLRALRLFHEPVFFAVTDHWSLITSLSRRLIPFSIQAIIKPQ
jgi:hypothetical protein